MNWPGLPLATGTVLGRRNRFTVGVRVEGRGAQEVAVHLPNSGRLAELLEPGLPCHVRPAAPTAGARAVPRRTAYDLVLVKYAGGLVCVDSRMPPHILREAAAAGLVPFLAGYSTIISEPVFHTPGTRFDLRLERPGGVVWVETKSCTLVRDGVAMFPDAPTARGVRHLDELCLAVAGGEGAAIVFVVQREDAAAFTPNIATDPEFAAHLRTARAAGVHVAAWDCRVSPEGITLRQELPVIL